MPRRAAWRPSRAGQIGREEMEFGSGRALPPIPPTRPLFYLALLAVPVPDFFGFFALARLQQSLSRPPAALKLIVVIFPRSFLC